MKLTKEIARQIRDVHFGGNWTDSSLKDHLADLSWQQAITKVDSLNTIATLVYHMNYYLCAVLKVVAGGPLTAKHKLSFDHPLIRNTEDWNALMDKTWADADHFATLVEKLPDSKLREDFSENKHGNYYYNIQGVNEHTHYHLGQIVLIKKLLLQEKEK